MDAEGDLVERASGKQVVASGRLTYLPKKIGKGFAPAAARVSRKTVRTHSSGNDSRGIDRHGD